MDENISEEEIEEMYTALLSLSNPSQNQFEVISGPLLIISNM